jgi:glycosyltransferase involved in cell wall biosynthesis
MLTPWSWNHHRFRKLLAQHFIHSGALAEVQGWHATSIEEAEQIKLLGFGQPICVAPNGVETPSTAAIENARLFWNERCPETTDRPVALFYSRFHRKKRVLELIDLWLSVAPKDWLLLLVGIPQEYSVEQLRDYVLRSSGQGRVAVFSGTDAPPPYAVASLFLLPSHTENFGMVVAEALIQGIPALVTDTTPWACINDTDFGWCGPWESFGNAMTASLALGPDVLKQRGKQAIPWVSAEYSWDKTAQKLSQFYEQLAKR